MQCSQRSHWACSRRRVGWRRGSLPNPSTSLSGVMITFSISERDSAMRVPIASSAGIGLGCRPKRYNKARSPRRLYEALKEPRGSSHRSAAKRVVRGLLSRLLKPRDVVGPPTDHPTAAEWAKVAEHTRASNSLNCYECHLPAILTPPERW